jgi:diguanylate cyclase (GGDEF)-like protein
VNDRFGHLAGNRVLRIVANGLREFCEADDYVARLGGDEFVMLIPGADEDELERKIDRMRNVARKAGEATPEPSVLSISVGIANFPEDGTDAEQLLAEADRRMYKGKRQRKKDRASVVPMQVPMPPPEVLSGAEPPAITAAAS